MIAYNRFAALMGSIPNCEVCDWFIAECGSSAMDVDENVEKTILMLKAMWAMAHDGLTIKSIAAACGRSMRSIGIEYGIPQRTIEEWSSGRNKPSDYVLDTLAYAVLADYVERVGTI